MEVFAAIFTLVTILGVGVLSGLAVYLWATYSEEDNDGIGPGIHHDDPGP